MNFLRDLFKTWFCKHDYFCTTQHQYTLARPNFWRGKYYADGKTAYTFTCVIYATCKKCYHKKEITEFWGEGATEKMNSFLENLNKK